MNARVFYRGFIRRNRHAVIAERIEGDSRSDVLRRSWIKDRVGLVEDAAETGPGYLRAGSFILHFAVAIARVVAPRAVKELVAADSQRGEERIGLVIKEAIAEFRQPRARPAGDDLI